MHVQTVLISRAYYPNIYKAKNKLRKDGFEFHKVDVTENYWRFRQAEPDDSKKYRTENTRSKGVKVIIQY